MIFFRNIKIHSVWGFHFGVFILCWARPKLHFYTTIFFFFCSINMCFSAASACSRAKWLMGSEWWCIRCRYLLVTSVGQYSISMVWATLNERLHGDEYGWRGCFGKMRLLFESGDDVFGKEICNGLCWECIRVLVEVSGKSLLVWKNTKSISQHRAGQLEQWIKIYMENFRNL